jgi:DNA helicase-2/ATP-dependent DNA helicase PcrA
MGLAEHIVKTASAKQTILNELNDQQKQPVMNYNGASMIIAGPGAGKTKTLVSRTAYMIEDGVDPHSILLFTFTRKGANEIKDRVESYIGKKASGVTVGTYHSFCMRVLRKYCDYLGWTKNFSIYDTDDQTAVLKKIVDGDMKPAVVAHEISMLKERMISPAKARQDAAYSYDANIARYYTSYMQAMKQVNAFDFDDLIYFTIRLFEEHPEVQAKINKKYIYIVADEAQDSSPRDLELIRRLGGDSMNVCLIGDNDQSIYAFRGSDINTVFDFVCENNMKQFVLGQNYRSTRTIVNASRSMIKNNRVMFEKDIFTDNTKGDPVVVMARDSQDREASSVVRVIKQCVRAGYKHSDIAILYRMSYLSRKIEDSFLKNSVPYTVLSGCPFYERKEVKDVLSYLRFICNDSDQIAFERILNTPKRSIGNTSLNKIITLQDELSCATMGESKILDACKEIKLRGKQQDNLKKFVAIIETLSDFVEAHTPQEIIKEIITQTDYFTYLVHDDPESADDRIANILELEEIASEYTNVHEFVNNMVLSNVDPEDEEENDRVSMMTMHSSKGLEFPVVVIIGATDGITPHYKAIDAGDIEEERRLFYVSMTRAKKNLFITYPKRMIRNGLLQETSPSRFIREINPDFIKEV